MSESQPEYALPSKVLPALRRLRLHYERKTQSDLAEIIEASRIFVVVETSFDNWNGGTYGHSVLLFVPEDTLGLLDLDKQSEVFERIREDLNKATPDIQNEFIDSVWIGAFDETDEQYQASVPFSREPRANPKEVGLWDENALRLFISHRDQEKALAHAIAKSLKPFGISSFVAHDAIKPMREWQTEILNGLATMEVMLVLLTTDFHKSSWTNQEVGFALGKGIPIVCVKTGTMDPQGFIGARQAIRADPDDMATSSQELLRSLLGEVHQAGRIKEVLVEAFVRSESYVDTIDSLKRLSETVSSLTDRDFSLIVRGYRDNDQLHGCAGIHNRNNWFKRYLEDATGKVLEIRDRNIVEIDEDIDLPPF